jgi:ribosomal protein S12 methylthiotransferase accessory factor
MYEVIERDSVTCWRLLVAAGRGRYRRIGTDTVTGDAPRELLDLFGAADVQALLFDCTTDTRVPTFMAYLVDCRARHVGLCRGYGAHLDPDVAISRALTEAAQSRVGLIAGARDDRFASDLRHAQVADRASRVAALTGIDAVIDASSYRNDASADFASDTATLLGRLAAVGLDRVGVLDLSRHDFGVPVVRVHVPGLEGYLTAHHRPGARARRFLEQA